MAYFTDGKSKDAILVSSSRDAQVKLWSVNEANEASLLHSHHEHLHFVNAVSFLPPSHAHPAGMVASAGADNIIRLLDMGSREMAGLLEGHVNNVCALFALNESNLVSGSWDSTAIVWNVDAGCPTYKLVGHENAVWAVYAINKDTFITGM